MKLPAYPKYKPSGVDWLGDVQEHWEVTRLKTSATCRGSNVDKVPAEAELPVQLCNNTNVPKPGANQTFAGYLTAIE